MLLMLFHQQIYRFLGDGLHADGGGFFRTGEGGQIERVNTIVYTMK